MGSGSNVEGLVDECSSGLVLEASMKASIRRSRYKWAGSMVKASDGDCSTRVATVDSEQDVEERIDGKLASKRSMASSTRPERMLVWTSEQVALSR
jgi:hypothetical protein